jgi:hypothetical protein
MLPADLPPDDHTDQTLDDSDSEAVRLAERIAQKLRDSRPLPDARVATPRPV